MDKYKLKKLCKGLLICVFSFENMFFGGTYTLATTVEMNLSDDNVSKLHTTQFNEEQEKQVEESPKKQKPYSESVTSATDTIATGTLGTSQWFIDSEGTLHIGEGEAGSYYTYESPWKDYTSVITKIVFEGKVVAGTRFHSIFYKLSKVETIENISYLDVSNSVNLYNLFGDMYLLRSLDLSTWDTSNVENMSYMFDRCKALTDLDLSTWDTSKVKQMQCIFRNCDNLTSVNISG